MRHPLLGKLEYEARVKPAIADLVAKVESMTYEEIEAAETPLPWFKTALAFLKAEKMANAAGQDMLNVSYGTVPDPMGKIAYWYYGDEFVKINQGMELEIKTGTLVFFPDTGGVWVEHVYGDQINSRLASLKVIGACTKSEYMCKYKADLLARVDGSTLSTTTYSDSQIDRPSPLARLGVRIYR